MVGLSIAGASAPMLMDMSLAPVIAQKRALNFGIAESAAVTYAAANEQQLNLLPLPTRDPDLVCVLNPGPSNIAHDVKCTKASGTKFNAVASRSFRLFSPNAQPPATTRTYTYNSPTKSSGHQCPENDTWGLAGTNDADPWGRACVPQAVWGTEAFLASNPDDWLYDVTHLHGVHPKY